MTGWPRGAARGAAGRRPNPGVASALLRCALLAAALPLRAGLMHYLTDLRHVEATKFEPFRELSELAHFHVAILNGTLYTTVTPQFEQRLDSTLHALLLLTRRRAVPDVYVGFLNIHDDGWQGGGAGPPVFSFSRGAGGEYPLLFPDADFWGWPHNWIAPHDMLAAQFGREQPAWSAREGAAYWGGTLLSENRGQYAACADAHPAQVKLRAESFDAVRAPLTHLSADAPKPASKDLRALLRNKYNVYMWGNGWSTSLKRIAMSGGAVVMPVPNPYDDLTSLALQRCNCTLSYDPARLCDSLLAVVNGTNDQLAYNYSLRSRAVATEELSAERLFAYIYGMLHGIAKTQDLSLMTPRSLDFRGFVRVDCEYIFHRYNNSMQLEDYQRWQLYEWFDPVTCEFRSPPSDYLRNSPL